LSLSFFNGITIFADSSLYFLSTKNQIGFKVKNEGNEIHCHLSENLSIDDYKSNYLGEWVEITGKISQAGDIIKEIEIEKLFFNISFNFFLNL
jgi:hypothetical protein